MAATKWLFCCGGITQPLTRQGLSSFFLKPFSQFHAKFHQHNLILSSDQPISVKTICHIPSEAHI